MKYNFHEHKDEELYVWALCHALGPLTADQMEEVDTFAIDIQLIVEGREINFLEFADNLYNQVDHIAKDKAQQFVADRLSEISNDLYTIGELARDRVDAMWKEVVI
jgi:hypothetical protein